MSSSEARCVFIVALYHDSRCRARPRGPSGRPSGVVSGSSSMRSLTGLSNQLDLVFVRRINVNNLVFSDNRACVRGKSDGGHDR